MQHHGSGRRLFAWSLKQWHRHVAGNNNQGGKIMKKIFGVCAVLLALSPLAQAQERTMREELRHDRNVVARDARAAGHKIAHPLRGKVRCRDGLIRTSRPGACAHHNGIARRY